jgi:hypothetical protein
VAAIPAFQLGTLDSPPDAPAAIAVPFLSSSIDLPLHQSTLAFIPAPVLEVGSGGGGGGDAVGYAG